MAGDVTDNVAAGGHVTLIRVTGVDIDDTMEQVGLAMLAPEVPRDDVLVVRKMRLACFATVDLVAGEVGVVGQAHCCGDWVSQASTVLVLVLVLHSAANMTISLLSGLRWQ